MLNEDCLSRLTNCIFSGNRAFGSPVGQGGAVFNHGRKGNVSFTNCTFIGNWADLGSAILRQYTDLTVENCILWGSAEQIFELFDMSFDDPIRVYYSNVQGGWLGEGNIDVEPPARHTARRRSICEVITAHAGAGPVSVPG